MYSDCAPLVIWAKGGAARIMLTGDHDLQLRLAAFSFLEGCVARHGDAVPRPVLASGGEFDGQIDEGNVAVGGCVASRPSAPTA